MSFSHEILTISIPTYNRAKFLHKNLLYLESQYKSNFNILIQDNASTDNTKQVVESFKLLGLPIDYKRNKRNLGWAKNFELCYKNCKTKYIMILGDDDYILKGGIDMIIKNIKTYNPSLIFLRAFSTKKIENREVKNELGEVLNRENFLTSSILQLRLISSFVIRIKNLKRVRSFTGNFAHLSLILTNIRCDNKFIFVNSKTVAVYPNNSGFIKKVNFSDIYVIEFFRLLRFHLKNRIGDDIFEIMENKMLKAYYPKLILKSRLRIIKKDDNLKDNFMSIFKSNAYFQRYKRFYIKNNLSSNIFLCYRICKSFF